MHQAQLALRRRSVTRKTVHDNVYTGLAGKLKMLLGCTDVAPGNIWKILGAQLR